MAFTAKNTDNTIAAVVNDYEATIVGGLQLLGYGYVNYAEEIANNFVRVAENFANATPPDSPLKGQLWWDTSDSANAALWVCRDPTAATSPVTARWSQIFSVNGTSGQVDAWTLQSHLPSVTSVADTVVVRDGSGKIDSASLPATIAKLDDLTDVTITTPASAQALRYNGSQWVNTKLTLDDLTNVSTSGATNGSILKFNGTTWVVAVDATGGTGSTTLSSLTDVNTSGAVNGSVLKYNGTRWVAGTDNTASGGGSAVWGGITGTVTDQTDLISYITGRTWPISAVTNLQTTLDSKLTLTSLKASDGAGSGIDSDLLDGQHGSYYLNYANFTGTPPSTGVSASSYATNGYAKIGTLVIQWGQIYMAASSATVTMPTTFPTGCLAVQVSVLGTPNASNTGAQDNIYYWPSAYSTSSFTLNASGFNRDSICVGWIAIGY